jgi:hypothetical protein
MVYDSEHQRDGGNDGKEALFHGWGIDGWSVDDYGNQSVGVINRTHAIVEFSDGSTKLVAANRICFCD